MSIEEKRINLGINIRKRRRWCECTQAHLGDLVGIPQQRIAQFEKGDAIPNVLQAERIAEVLDTTIERLLSLEGI